MKFDEGRDEHFLTQDHDLQILFTILKHVIRVTYAYLLSSEISCLGYF